MTVEKYDAIIIGSGMGGLATGLHLQNNNPNLKTLILEQHSIPGGSVNGFKRKGYYFDSGAEGIIFCGKGQIFRNNLENLGVLQDFISIDPVEVLKFSDKTVVMHNGIEKFIEELIQNFPNEEEEILKYFQIVKRMSKEFFSLSLNTMEPSFRDLLKIAFTRPTLRRYGLKTFQQLLDKFITNPELRKVLAVYCLWLGVQPDKISAAIAAIVFNSPFIDGNFYPKGGMLAFSKKMADVYKSTGGTIRYKSKVEKIIVKKRRAIGVKLKNGESIYSKWIISNADLKKTIFDFVGKEFFTKAYQKIVSKIKQSVTGFAVFLGLDKQLDDYHSHFAYNVDAEKYLDRLTKGSCEPEEVLIRIPQNIDPSLRNDEGASVVLLALTPHNCNNNWGIDNDGKRSEKYLQMKEKFADKLIKLAEKVIPDLSKRIKVKEIATPLTFERYIQSTEGSWYGPQTGQKLPSFKTPLKRLLLAGGNVGGAGVPTSFLSGLVTAKHIIKKINRGRKKEFPHYFATLGEVSVTAPLPLDL